MQQLYLTKCKCADKPCYVIGVYIYSTKKTKFNVYDTIFVHWKFSKNKINFDLHLSWYRH